ncbi:MAG: hypothetical protein AAB466_11890 [Verrucomicrobiota bacterium]
MSNLAAQIGGPGHEAAHQKGQCRNSYGEPARDAFSSAEQDKPRQGGHTQNHQTSESKLRDLFMLCEECVRNAGLSFHRLFSRLAGEICRNAQDGNDNEHTEAYPGQLPAFSQLSQDEQCQAENRA